MDINKCNFRTLWVEDRVGNIGEVDMVAGVMPPVDEFPFAISRFPQELTTTVYRRRDDGGYGGKDQITEGHHTFNNSTLIIALVLGGRQWWRRLFWGLRRYTLGEAIILYTTACERCLNVLHHTYGVTGGYAEFSPAWQRCNTTCCMCKHLGQRAVNPGSLLTPADGLPL